ncbi:unnamed protein product [Cyprideis torosa]|uniref:Uncharacterized protein n=1 Tax=Cyprideis torosa TaxID=163714 RepID=A0A7R8WBC2_9CRUS|nr:unnamed protein product [Cyprideis torosa]CAG0892143.1 unnamed protein product [Cyprideis torosa]
MFTTWVLMRALTSPFSNVLIVPEKPSDINKRWFQTGLDEASPTFPNGDCQQEQGNWRVTSLTTAFQSSLSKGSNFLGELIPIRVTWDQGGLEQTGEFLVKIPPRNEPFRTWSAVARSHEKEYTFYKKILPELQFLILSRCPGRIALNVPTLTFGRMYSPEKVVLVFEDLRCSGFKMANKFTGLTVDETEQALITLAAYHGTCLAWIQTLRQKGISLGELHPILTHFFHDTMMKIRPDSLTNQLEFLIPAVKRHEGMEVIRHGDCWTNNLLFKYDATGTRMAFLPTDSLNDLHGFTQSLASLSLRKSRRSSVHLKEDYTKALLKGLTIACIALPTTLSYKDYSDSSHSKTYNQEKTREHFKSVAETAGDTVHTRLFNIAEEMDEAGIFDL